MAIRKIRQDDDEILRKISKPVDKVSKRIITLLEDMEETMFEFDGIGLAAPQIGVLKRVIVINIGEGTLKIINPEIIEETGEQTSIEGCLSVTGFFGEVARPYKVKVKGLNEKGEEMVIEGEELLARVLCHEIDHLNGILFTDKASRLIDKDEYREELNKNK